MSENSEEHMETGIKKELPKGRRRFLRRAGAAAGAVTLGAIGASPATASDHQTLTLGEDTTYTELNRSKAGEVVQGALVLDRSASTGNRSGKYMRTYVSALTGIGSARLWGTVGQRFIPEGDSPQLAEIETQGSIKGDLRAIANSGSWGIIHLNVVDFTEETSIHDSIFRAGGHGIFERSVDSNFSGSITTQLQPGHKYTVWVRLTSRVDTLTDNLNVLPRSDFFRDDRRAVVDEISIQF